MVPNGWEHKAFGEVVKLSKSKYDPKKSTDCFPCIELEHIAQETGQLTGNVPASNLGSTKNKFKAGDVIFGKLRPYLRKYAQPNFDGVCSSEIWVFSPTKKIINPYLFQLVQTNQFISEANKSAGSKMPRADWGVVSEMVFPLPPLPEQRKIAKILSTWDKAISTTERLIDNSKQQKKALMQQLLTGKKRLLDDSGKPFEGEWDEKCLSEFGNIYSGGTPSTAKPEYWDGTINWVTPTDITKQDSIYIESTARLVSMVGIKNSSAKLLPKGTLLVCTRATIGEMAIARHEMSTNQGFKNIVPNENTNIEFVYYLLNFYKHKLISKASGSTFLELSKSAFEGLHFYVPEYQEQKKIAAVLLNADREIDALQQQLADLIQEKKALMQQLLTGKRRVKLDDKEVA